MKDYETTLEINALGQGHYDIIKFLDYCKTKLGATSDRSLADKLGCSHIYISKLRNRHIGVSSGFLILVHQSTGIGFNDLRRAAGIATYTPKRNKHV